MAGDTDLDLALAVALAEASDGYSDDDFKPSIKQVEHRQQKLLAKCSNFPLTKNKRRKTQLCRAAAREDQRIETGAPKNRKIAGHKQHKNGRNEVKNRTNELHEVDVDGVQNGLKSDSLDSFRYHAPKCQDGPQPVSPFEESNLVAKLQQVSESASNQNNSSIPDEDFILTTDIGSPETNQPQLRILHDLERKVSVFNEEQDDLTGYKNMSPAHVSDSEEIIGLDEESQFSALLRLCTEERADKDQRSVDPGSSVVESGAESPRSGRRDSQVQNVALSNLDTMTYALGSDLDDGVDDISYLLTQQRVSQRAQIESCAEGCIAAFQDIPGRSKGTDDQEGLPSGSALVNVSIMCPICEYDLSEISLQLRVKHTEMCLSKIAEPQECLKDHTSEELQPISRDLSISFGCEKVSKWLEGLNLSRYLDSFNQHEIDWDTLQWLTDEDLQLIGVTCLGPRRKILGALQELKPAGSNKNTEPLVVPAARVEDDISRNAETSRKDSVKLITNFFPITTGTGKKCVTNVVKQNTVVSEHGRTTSRVASSRPKTSHHPSIRGVPPWMCIPGTPFRVDAFQHLSGDCTHWFLTHFHTDHYQGLTRGFRYGRIFCSAITARLVNLRIGVSWDRLMIVPLNEKFKICGVDVTFIDANHCPGSVMILFEPPNGEAVLHTGDFRFCSAMAGNLVLQSTRVHTLILDTTYCDPQYDFPKQESVIQFVIDAIQAEAFNRETLFLIGTYTIGKERIFLEVGKVLQKKIYVGSAKMKLLECMDLSAEDRKWLTCNDQESFIHVVPLWSISSFRRMNSISRHYHGRYKLLVAFSPTGWSFGRGKKKTPGKRHQQGTMIRYEVPYSEHSSFCELKEFVNFTAPLDIIPSVPGKSSTVADDMIASLWSENQ